MNNIEKYNNFISIFKTFEINEGLIKTQEPGVLLTGFQRLMRFNGSNAIINYDDEGRLYVDCKDITKKDAEFIFSLIGNYGYFVSEFIINGINDKFDEKNFIEIYFHNQEKIDVIFYIEAKFDTSIKDAPQLLYHSTLTEYVENILERGLFPKTKNKISTHPPRIYLSNSINNAIVFSRFSKAKHFKEMTILEIDTTKIKPSVAYNGEIKNFKLYRDPNYKGKGYYTLHNVPKESIKTTGIVV